MKICPVCLHGIADQFTVLGAFGKPLFAVHHECAPIAKIAARQAVRVAGAELARWATNLLRASNPALGAVIDKAELLLEQTRQAKDL